jgi:ferrous iron transport protein B
MIKIKEWFCIKVFERDEKVLQQLSLDEAGMDEIEAVISDCENKLDDDSQSIITSERYLYIEEITRQCLTKAKRDMI